MSKKKKAKTGGSFTSLRILGEKAQKLLSQSMKKETPPHSPEPPPSHDRAPEVEVDISVSSVAKATLVILGVALGVVLLYILKDKLVLVLLAIFVAAVIDPGVGMLRRYGIPRPLGIVLHYFIALFLLVFLFVSLIPVLASQIQQIGVYLGTQVNNFLTDPMVSLPFFSPEANLRMSVFMQNTLRSLSITDYTAALARLGENVLSTPQGSLLLAAQLAGSVVDFVLNLMLILVLAFFFQLEKDRIVPWMRGFLPWNYRTYVADKSEAIQWKLAQWIRGQLLLCLSVGAMVFLALNILRMPYALTLAILAGFTEFIPVVGPLLAAIPAVIIGSTQQGPVWGLVILAVYYVVQWCENNLLVPLIMKRTIGLSPVAVMFAMLAGMSFPDVVNPVLGLILAIPMTAIISLFLEDWRLHRSHKHGAALPHPATLQK